MSLLQMPMTMNEYEPCQSVYESWIPTVYAVAKESPNPLNVYQIWNSVKIQNNSDLLDIDEFWLRWNYHFPLHGIIQRLAGKCAHRWSLFHPSEEIIIIDSYTFEHPIEFLMNIFSGWLISILSALSILCMKKHACACLKQHSLSGIFDRISQEKRNIFFLFYILIWLLIDIFEAKTWDGAMWQQQ